MSNQLSHYHTDHCATGSARNDRAILENYRDTGITSGPGRPGADQDASVLVGHCRSVMNRVAERGRSIDRRAQANPRRAHVADRLMRFRCADYAVRNQGGENRNERCPRRGGDCHYLRRVLDPLRSFFRGFEDLLH